MIRIEKELKTKRLILRDLSKSDTAFILELTNTDGWIRFIGDRNIRTILDAEDYIEKILANEDIRYWTVNLSESETPIGLITLIKRAYLKDFDIGFAFLPKYGKQGYAYEAAKPILSKAMEGSLTNTIYATTKKDNVNSIKLLEKLGLSFAYQMERDEEQLEIYALSRTS